MPGPGLPAPTHGVMRFRGRSDTPPLGSAAAEFGQLVQQLEQCRDALQSYTGPAIRRTVTDGVTVETLVDQRQQTVRDAARIMTALNAERKGAPAAAPCLLRGGRRIRQGAPAAHR